VVQSPIPSTTATFGVGRGARAVFGVLTAIYLLGVLALLLSSALRSLAELFPSLAMGILLWSSLVLLGPAPFHVTSLSVYSGWPYHPLLWIGIAVVFGVVTRRVASRWKVRTLATLTVIAVLVPMTLVAQSRMAMDWRRGSDAMARAFILSRTPIGTSMEQVDSLIEKEGWRYVRTDHTAGFVNNRVRPTRTVGSKHISASAGSFVGPPMAVHSTVFWGFDDSGHLVDVWVRRIVDAP
jgi:hypothetical protein